MFGLSEAWDLAWREIQKSQKYQYDRHAKQRDFWAGDRVCSINKLARIESFPGLTLDLIGCWKYTSTCNHDRLVYHRKLPSTCYHCQKYIQMVSLFDQLTAPMINLSELIWIEWPCVQLSYLMSLGWDKNARLRKLVRLEQWVLLLSWFVHVS